MKMKGLFLLSALALAAGVCYFTYCDTNRSENAQPINPPDEPLKTEPKSSSDLIVRLKSFFIQTNILEESDMAKVSFLTIQWLIYKIKKIIAKKNVQKVAVIGINRMIEECPNTDILISLRDKGVDLLMVAVDCKGAIIKVQSIIADEIDIAVIELLGDEGMLVVNR